MNILDNIFKPKQGGEATITEEHSFDKDGKPAEEMTGEQIAEEIERLYHSDAINPKSFINYKGLLLIIENQKGTSKLAYEIQSPTNKINWYELYDETKQGDLRNAVGKILKRAETQL